MPPARKKTSPALIALIVAGAAVASLLVGGGLMYALFFHEVEKPVTEADRELLLTADSLVPVLEGLTVNQAKGTLKKVGHLDGSAELVYEYDDAENEAFPLYVTTTVTYEPKSSDARMIFAATELGLNLGLTMSGDDQLSRRDCPYTLSLGAETKCYELVYGGAPIGVAVSVLANRRVMFFNVSGVHFDGETLEQLLAPRVAKGRDWKP